MTELDKRLLLAFLDELSEHQSCAGCNDYDLSHFIPDPAERRKFIHEIGETYTDNNDRIVSDTSVLAWIVEKVKYL